MTIEATVNDLVASVGALTNSVVTKRAVLDVSANNADASAVAAVNSANAAAASATAAAASATTATSQTAEITAFKTAATALNTSTTATQAVTNLLPDMLAKKDPARHPFRNKLPSLVLDFERQKAHRYSDSTGFAETPLASFMTFVRNSTATYTGPDGVLRTAGVNQPRYDYDPVTGECKGLLVEEQRTNLLIQSQSFHGWITGGSNSTVSRDSFISPDGVMSCIDITLGDGSGMASGIFKAGINVTADTTYTTSIYVKKNIGSYVSISVEGSVAFGGTSWIRLDQVTGSTQSLRSDGAMTTVAVQDLGTWFRFSLTRTAVAGGAATICFYSGVSGANRFVIYGAQLEAGAFPTSYIPTPATFTGRTSTATYLDANGVVQTAGVGVARSAAYGYDSDGVLRPIGLLLENSATNLLLHSSDYTNAAWAKNVGGTGSTPVVTAAYGIAPDGTTTAQRVQLALNGGTTINDHSTVSQSTTTVAGSTYTISVWLKTADASTKAVQLSFNGENTQLLTVTGTWKRFSITGTASDTNRGFRLALRGTTGTSDSADLLMWGAQHGLGNYATSYIPTTTAQVTRAADSSTSAQATRVADAASLSGTNFSSWYNQEQGTLTIRGAVQLGGTGWPGLAVITDSSNSNRWGFYVGDNDDKVRFSSKKNTAEWAVTGLQPVTAHAPFSVASAVKYATASSVLQGGSVANINAAGAVPRASSLKIGVFDNAANSCIRRITYYPTAFTNEELQVLTSA